jgi:hypothetical protein
MLSEIAVKELDNVMSFIQTPLVAIVVALLIVLAAGYLGLRSAKSLD